MPLLEGIPEEILFKISEYCAAAQHFQDWYPRGVWRPADGELLWCADRGVGNLSLASQKLRRISRPTLFRRICMRYLYSREALIRLVGILMERPHLASDIRQV